MLAIRSTWCNRMCRSLVYNNASGYRWLVHECGVHPDVATGDGTTPLHYAVWQGHLDLCKWFVYAAGADFASVNEFGCNAMQWAGQTDHLAMCRWLAALGLDLSIINNNGHSALHKAANKGQARVCAWLLNEECLGVQHLQPDQDGNSPAVMARLEGHHKLADALDAALLSLQAFCSCACGIAQQQEHPETERNCRGVAHSRAECKQDCTSEGTHSSAQPHCCSCRCRATLESGPFRMDGAALEGVLGGDSASLAQGAVRKGSSVSEHGACTRRARLRRLAVRSEIYLMLFESGVCICTLLAALCIFDVYFVDGRCTLCRSCGQQRQLALTLPK
jgi:Ankyrin repeats (many copies)